MPRLLRLARTGLLYAAAAAAFTGGMHAQTQPPPRYEVATIRPSPQAFQPGRATFPSPGRVSVPDFTLQNLIGFAYGGGGGGGMEITGGPDWINRDRYTVQAQAPGNPSRDDLRLMMRTLLAERFALKVHFESKEVDVYALVLARSDGRLGPNVQLFEGECGTTPPAPPCPALINPPTGLRLGGQPMAMLANLLSAPITNLGRRVEDRTGLTGRFNMTFEFSFSRPGADAAAPDTSAPSLFTALQEQLGVKLEPSRGTVRVLVVDHADRPTEN